MEKKFEKPGNYSNNVFDVKATIKQEININIKIKKKLKNVNICIKIKYCYKITSIKIISIHY